ncbi:MAG: extracellular solute-binding protein [Deltaproteobacteria bacterium]|nr:extracellular solute-binding protein [Deltaproteobacteria bacterium]
MLKNLFFVVAALLSSGFFSPGPAQPAQSGGAVEWEKIVEAARKEGKVVASIPPSAQVRKGLEEAFAKRFGIVMESVPARGSTVIRRIVEESRAGVRYFDVHVGGTESVVKGLLPENVLDAVEPWFLLPEVKDQKNWWGGHIWIDRGKRYIYGFSAYQTASLWYNSTLVKPEEVRSFDDLLDARWKGRIGLSDPRTPGSGASIWSYMMLIKGEDFLKKLVAQKMVLARDLRLLAENLAKGRVAIALGIGYSESLPFIKAGLPVSALPTPKEGLYTTGGYGHLTIIKNPPHPNATKVFVNWLLGKEAQEIFSRAMGAPTRRLDVDTRWSREVGVVAAKDGLTLEQFYRMENQSEERIYKIRDPAALARKLFD